MADTKYTVEVTDANFEDVVLKASTPVLVDFWAAWCGPCLAVAPTLEELAQEYEGKFVIAKLDVDRNPETSQKYGIMNIPTMLYFQNGQQVDKQVGAAPKKAFQQKIDALVGA